MSVFLSTSGWTGHFSFQVLYTERPVASLIGHLGDYG